MNRKALFNVVIIGAVSLLLVSCAAPDQKQVTLDQTDKKNGLVVRDMLIAESQVLVPGETTLQLNPPSSDFGKELENGLREVGYGTRHVSADHGPNFLSYSKNTIENSGKVYTTKYTINMGDIGFERVYANMDGGGIAPTGPMVVYGTNKEVRLGLDLFPGQSVEVVYAEDDEIDFDPDSITVIDSRVMSAITELRSSELPPYKSLNSQNQEIENLFERGSSNFESIDENFRTVRKDIIIFDNDSLDLKRRGRDQIADIMKYFKPQTDVFRLIGCSLGPTKAEGGNVELALGRSERVAKELVARSVNVDSIYDEGCWAPSSGEVDFPARAVVVQLERRS